MAVPTYLELLRRVEQLEGTLKIEADYCDHWAKESEKKGDVARAGRHAERRDRLLKALETDRFVATAGTDDEEQILKQALELEEAIGDVLRGKLKPAKMPIEPMVRLIAFAKAKLLRSQ